MRSAMVSNKGCRSQLNKGNQCLAFAPFTDQMEIASIIQGKSQISFFLTCALLNLYVVLNTASPLPIVLAAWTVLSKISFPL